MKQPLLQKIYCAKLHCACNYFKEFTIDINLVLRCCLIRRITTRDLEGPNCEISEEKSK